MNFGLKVFMQDTLRATGKGFLFWFGFVLFVCFEGMCGIAALWWFLKSLLSRDFLYVTN